MLFKSSPADNPGARLRPDWQMTRRHRLILVLGMTMAGSITLATRQAPAPATAAAPDEPAVILRIVGRDSTLVASAGDADQGPTYALYSNAGELLIPRMTLPQLQAAHPDLARRIQHLHADQSATPIHWAGIDLD
ncbi:hypothetical protein [Fontivita pretiosa]|jgi:hypothetical protein|uniref:hypothetical protein n=1 Tax=Fontivita pretiosa TaxID=2989684 RepID=UPI003D16C89C